jgi:hypothetical protein
MAESRLVRHLFSEEEDERLRGLISELGEDDWRSVSERMTDRTARQCKERWTHYLSPHLVRENWTSEEDDMLCDLVKDQGKKWKQFEARFPGRTDINIKNRFNVLTRKKAKELKIALKLPLKRKRASAEKPAAKPQDWTDFMESDPCADLLSWSCGTDHTFF